MSTLDTCRTALGRIKNHLEYHVRAQRFTIPEDRTHIYELDWDVLIVLDACRPDALHAIAPHYPWLTDIETHYSLAGYSLDWLTTTFTPPYRAPMQETGFIAWNPYTSFTDQVTPQTFGALREVWRDGWDNDLGCIPPETVTDAAIDVHETTDCDRLIAWYMQPHTPWRAVDDIERLHENQIGNEDNGRRTVWDLLRQGEMTQLEATLAMGDSLQWALTDIERLLARLPNHLRVVVTADHGELFGEHGRWGHPKQQYHPEQLQIPVADVDLTRLDEQPSYQHGTTADNVDDQLEALGYREEAHG